MMNTQAATSPERTVPSLLIKEIATHSMNDVCEDLFSESLSDMPSPRAMIMMVFVITPRTTSFTLTTKYGTTDIPMACHMYLIIITESVKNKDICTLRFHFESQGEHICRRFTARKLAPSPIKTKLEV
mmetsp:Transcript_11343/g.15849  ORF Transcript_11343/g.15849 Transcript_11343/m.15849 type:complete len:128 (+) Transcript_11343:1313-1696(+)